MKLEKIPLKTVRPLYYKEICLGLLGFKPDDDDGEKKVEAFCAEEVEELVKKATKDHPQNPKRPSPPLIRLRVDNSGGFPTFNVNRLAQQFVNKVANPQDIIRFHAKVEATSGKEKGW
ncbi:Double-strand break repair protein MRE11 [Holothuria leucospilota]|uniref:Double-strand break repair protein MRE11 n=1 Tax=Holothuria leucospilota TaxID=206669 RepID=A0A9Q1BZE5_HOLLE|nr:Double-strand break repair protein MRE11 [Holothuria leucospilota]